MTIEGVVLDWGGAGLRRVYRRAGLGGMVRTPAHYAQSGRAAGASYCDGRACVVAQSDVSVAHDHLRGHSARAWQSLAVGPGGPAMGRHELGS